MQPEQVRHIVAFATLAPSVHNTQPWRFVATTDGIDVWADRARLLPATDPEGRELLLSCGAAVLHAELAVRSLGRSCRTELLPTPTEPDLLARLHVGAEQEPDEAERALIAAAPNRHTDREPFDDRAVPEDLLSALQHGVSARGAWLRILEAPDDRLVAAALLARADEEQVGDAAYREELRAWVRSTPAPDGVPAETVPEVPPSERASTYRIRDFSDTDQGGRPREGAPVERPTVVVLGTTEDDPHAWLQAGRALAWLLLEATAGGVSASPMTQVVERPDTRAQLRSALGVVGYPQIVLRLGYGHGGHRSPRRPVDDVLSL